MRPRLIAVIAAAVLGLLLAAVPIHAQAPSFRAILAEDNFFTTAEGGAPNVTIAAGGHVNFVYFSGNSRHNVAFTGARPTVCGISEGPAGTEAALPAQPSPPLWEGGCDFETPGTYAFVCELHPSMRGSVTVVSGPGTPAPPAPDIEFSVGDRAASGVKVASQQRGVRIRGSVLVPRRGSRLLARVFVSQRTLRRSRSTKPVEVGRQLRRSVGGGRVTFSTTLNASARSALRRNGRLRVTLRLTVTRAGRASYRATRTVVVRPS